MFFILYTLKKKQKNNCKNKKSIMATERLKTHINI